MLAGCISIEANQPGKTPQEMPYDEALAKYRQLGEVKEFLNTDTPLKYPWSLDKFFFYRQVNALSLTGGAITLVLGVLIFRFIKKYGIRKPDKTGDLNLAKKEVNQP